MLRACLLLQLPVADAADAALNWRCVLASSFSFLLLTPLALVFAGVGAAASWLSPLSLVADATDAALRWWCCYIHAFSSTFLLLTPSE